MLHTHDIILIVDFGSQYTQLIARKIRELGVYSEIIAHHHALERLNSLNPKGLVLSGGPMSVYDENSPSIDPLIFAINIPILGICYGLQLTAKFFGAEVSKSDDREYGRANLNILQESKLFNGVQNHSTVWMSHGDKVTELPNGFILTASSNNTAVCAIENREKNIFGIQFHPEVHHTEYGKKILSNFIFEICGAKKDWNAGNIIDEKIIEIKEKVGNANVICALSGGVDSTVAAVLVQRAIGDNLFCIHVDTGLMRKNESKNVAKMFEDDLSLNVRIVDASNLFISRLKGVVDPELKRKIIGNTFIEVFEQEAEKIPNVKFLVQGTLYPDVIESVSVKGESVTIKTHHNVGGLPEKMSLKLIEPLNELFKDEVREIGKQLNINEHFLMRHPFPGPGLAIRILGEVTEEKLEILKEADSIFIEEIQKEGLYEKIWQALAVLLPVQSVGVMGDSRTYENVLALRAVTSIDGMTADWFQFEHDVLGRISNKIINSVRGINRVVYDISSKPPATIEWE